MSRRRMQGLTARRADEQRELANPNQQASGGGGLHSAKPEWKGGSVRVEDGTFQDPDYSKLTANSGRLSLAFKLSNSALVNGPLTISSAFK